MSDEQSPPGEPSAQVDEPHAADAWGRVGDDGTVYVRTADGERAVGSYQAGDAAEALAYFQRKFATLAVEVALLEKRLGTTELAPDAAMGKIGALREAVRDANAVGDLAALEGRLDALVGRVDEERRRRAQVKAQEAEAARAAKTRIVESAEQAAHGSDWRRGSDRFRELLTEWKKAPRLDRRTDDELWHRFSAARTAWTKRRRAHFAELDEKREEARVEKDRLVKEAEALASSREWGPTSSALRELMKRWKAAGPAPREVEPLLWARFRAAQDAFFEARNAVFAERDAEEKANLEKKTALAAEAEALLPLGGSRDLGSVKAALRSIAERWEAIGHVPRDARGQVEGRLAAVERTVRESEQSEWRRTNPEARARAEATVAQLRTSVADLSRQLERARADGDERAAAAASEALEARTAWLDEAERTLADLTR